MALKAPLCGLWPRAQELFFFSPSPWPTWLRVVSVVVLFCFFFTGSVFLANFGLLMGSHAIRHHSYTYIKCALLSGLQ